MLVFLNKNNGFTLIEAAIAILLAGLLAASIAQSVRILETDDHLKTTQERLSAVDQAVKIFITKNRRAPCVARIDAPPDTENFGKETDCSTMAGPGVRSFPGRDSMEIRRGAVPVRSLNLPDKYMMDGWGNRFTYNVTALMAAGEADYAANDGAIDIRDQDDNNLLPEDRTGLYFVHSHGKDGVGAQALSGVPFLACSGDGLDRQNCDDNATFIGAAPFSESKSEEHFDDYVRFAPKQTSSIAINRYMLDFMPCDPDYGYYTPPMNMSGTSHTNAYGENCASAIFSVVGPEGIALSSLADIPTTGKLLYSRTIRANNTGMAVIRATIPVRYDNVLTGCTPNPPGPPSCPNEWERAIMGAIYVDGNLIVNGDLANPISFQHVSGGTGAITGAAPIVKDQDYTIEIYVFKFTHHNNNSPIPSAWAGTIKLADHAVEGAVEIMESGIN